MHFKNEHHPSAAQACSKSSGRFESLRKTTAGWTGTPTLGPRCILLHALTEQPELCARGYRARIANVLFLEAPIGVGFSYTDEPGYGAGITVNDNSTAEMSYEFLQRWLDVSVPLSPPVANSHALLVRGPAACKSLRC